jgi:selenide,water dikinase
VDSCRTISHSSVLSRDQLSERCGCLAKLAPLTLDSILREVSFNLKGPGSKPPIKTDSVELPPLGGQGLASVDFGPLVCPDPVRAGRIAALHALSDIYASGGDPLASLGILVVDDSLPLEVTIGVLTGLAGACEAEGAPLLGGHTIVGAEPLVGLAAVGTAGRRSLGKTVKVAGEHLLLSKPLGIGLILRAYRQGLVDEEHLEEALSWMEESNKAAAGAIGAAGVSAATDVTGFGLVGHLAEMLEGSGCGASIDTGSVPMLASAIDLPTSLHRSAWIDRNLEYCRETVGLSGVIDPAELAVLADPQTSGGLLVATDDDGAARLSRSGFQVIGQISSKPGVEVCA